MLNDLSRDMCRLSLSMSDPSVAGIHKNDVERTEIGSARSALAIVIPEVFKS